MGRSGVGPEGVWWVPGRSGGGQERVRGVQSVQIGDWGPEGICGGFWPEGVQVKG